MVGGCRTKTISSYLGWGCCSEEVVEELGCFDLGVEVREEAEEESEEQSV